MPTDPATLRAGQRVRITGAAGSVDGAVLETATPPALPRIPGAPAVELVREILAEWDVRQMALLTYYAGDGQAVMFVALCTSHGWRDLKGHRLTITPEAKHARP